MVTADPRSAEIIKPILRGRDIKRYQAKWAGKWLIDSHNGYNKNLPNYIPAVDIEKYPAVKAHLNKYWHEIKKRQDKGDTPYNLRNCAYHAEFGKEKIVWADIATKPTFYFLEAETYLNNTAYMIIGAECKYIIGILNSPLIKFYFPMIASHLGENGVRYFKQFVENIPIPMISEVEQKPFISLVDQILTAKKVDSSADTSKLETEINILVYKLYDLNNIEINFVDH